MRAGALRSRRKEWAIVVDSESRSFRSLASFVCFFAFALSFFLTSAAFAVSIENEKFLENPKYLDNEEIRSLFANIQREYPHLAQAYSIGKTIEKRDMNALALTVSVPDDNALAGDLLRPLIKVTANLHGDETLGRQMILYLAQYLTLNYATNIEVQQFLNTTEIHLLPSCNPDGFAKAKINGGTISWTCKKQSCTALSSTEAEFIALSEACKEAIWIRQLLSDMHFKQLTPTEIFEDNQSCLRLIKEQKLSNRTKHIDTRAHFVKEHIDQKNITCTYCPSEDMLADMFTKPLSPSKLEKHRIQAGLHFV